MTGSRGPTEPKVERMTQDQMLATMGLVLLVVGVALLVAGMVLVIVFQPATVAGA